MLLNKAKDVLLSVLPVAALVIIIHIFISPLPTGILINFYIGLGFVVIGLLLFLIGVDLGITPVGDTFGTRLAKKGKLWIVIIAGLVLGFMISAAEPSVLILAQQVNAVTGDGITNISLIIAISISVGIFVMIGLIRILFNIPLYILLIISYSIVLILAFIVGPEMVAIAFDASGATTGAMTVPFVLAISTGISALKKQSKSAEKDSFGLISLASVGAIIGVLVLGLFVDVVPAVGFEVEQIVDQTIFFPFVTQIVDVIIETLLIVSPILILFIFFQIVSFRIHRKKFIRIIKGFIYIIFGLIFFLNGVYHGFMDAGLVIGLKLFDLDLAIILVIGFALGLFSILAEPSVYVLTRKIEDVTAGYISSKLVIIFLGIGVGLAVLLNVLRIYIISIELWHILIVGYLIALGLIFIVPKLFVGIAFDAGGVASGPISATFIFAFSQGIAFGLMDGQNLVDLFGLIALIAMMPIIVIQLLGLIYKFKSKKEGVS
jgi:hypothetical protein